MTWQHFKPIIKYLAYFITILGVSMLIMTTKTDFMFMDVLGFKLMFGGMIAWWLVFFGTKFYWFDDAEFFDAKVLKWLGFISALGVLGVQLYLRYNYGVYNFFPNRQDNLIAFSCCFDLS